jgi:ABC-type glycerol-3-phosphate transport system substrate-binding protein
MQFMETANTLPRNSTKSPDGRMTMKKIAALALAAVFGLASAAGFAADASAPAAKPAVTAPAKAHHAKKNTIR